MATIPQYTESQDLSFANRDYSNPMHTHEHSWHHEQNNEVVDPVIKKRMQNRNAQRLYRQRQKARMEELEAKVRMHEDQAMGLPPSLSRQSSSKKRSMDSTRNSYVQPLVFPARSRPSSIGNRMQTAKPSPRLVAIAQAGQGDDPSRGRSRRNSNSNSSYNYTPSADSSTTSTQPLVPDYTMQTNSPGITRAALPSPDHLLDAHVGHFPSHRSNTGTEFDNFLNMQALANDHTSYSSFAPTDSHIITPFPGKFEDTPDPMDMDISQIASQCNATTDTSMYDLHELASSTKDLSQWDFPGVYTTPEQPQYQDAKHNGSIQASLSGDDIGTASSSGESTASYTFEQERVRYVADGAKSVGFRDFDEAIEMYYNSQFSELSALRTMQKLSRKRHLPEVLAEIRRAAQSWSKWERSGLEHEMVRCAEGILKEECDTLYALDQHDAEPSTKSTSMPPGTVSPASSPDRSGGSQPSTTYDIRWISQVPNLWALVVGLCTKNDSLASEDCLHTASRVVSSIRGY